VEINIQQNRDNLEVDNASLFLWFGFSFGMSHLALTRKLIGTSGRRSKSFVRIQRSSVWVISSARSAQTAQWLGTIKRMLHSIATVCDRGGTDREIGRRQGFAVKRRRRRRMVVVFFVRGHWFWDRERERGDKQVCRVWFHFSIFMQLGWPKFYLF
jgi:hypothetical protein